MKRSKWITALISPAIVAGLISGASPAAAQINADETTHSRAEESAVSKHIVYKYVNTRYYHNKVGKKIGSCKVGRNGGTCTVSQSKSISDSVSTSFGISKSAVSANIGMSYSTSVSITVQCTSPKLKKGQVWTGYAMGTRIGYTIEKWQKSKPTGAKKWTWKRLETSGRLGAYDVINDIYCE